MLLPNINGRIEREKVSYGGFLVFIRVWLMIATIQGTFKRDFWSAKKGSAWGALLRVSDYMTQNHFEAILYFFKYTDEEAPQYKDSFHEVGQMLLMCNENMDQYFTPGWITCLDESMSFWSNNYTCPGFMLVPQKPWPFGNKYHNICCRLLGVLFGIELVEEKDWP